MRDKSPKTATFMLFESQIVMLPIIPRMEMILIYLIYREEKLQKKSAGGRSFRR